ncbi:MAG: class II fructose-bisphosphatase [Deltaproteobacteria bacterium]|nr:MAG: class II fructose-bisphosphatase [Deltaproteobacteria bacterium]
MDRNLALEVVRVTEAAALATARLMGRGDGPACDAAAVEAMRRAFDTVDVCGEVVIGEGEKDRAPMLYIGEKVGCGEPGEGVEVDVAVDPLEGTRLCARGEPNAISVVAMAPKGNLLRAPDTYMEKIAVGPSARGAVDLSLSAGENLRRIADAKGVYIDDLTVCILDRPRHEDLIREVREAGARIKLINDGDVSAAVATCLDSSGVDVLMGIGGAPEGVISAAAIKCFGGDMQGRLRPHDEATRQRMGEMGLKEEGEIYRLDELAQGEVMFAATGVTGGDLLRGVRYFAGGARTHSVVMRSKSGTIRSIETTHHFDRKPNYGW